MAAPDMTPLYSFRGCSKRALAVTPLPSIRYFPTTPLEFASPEFINSLVLSSVPAASTTRFAFTVISRRLSRSTKFAPFTSPVFLSTVRFRTTAFSTASETGNKPKPKYLRVLVEAADKFNRHDGKPTKVNIRVPMALLRAGVRLTSLIPPSARDQVNEQLSKNGVPFDIGQLKPENLEDLISHLDDLTVDVDAQDAKVRIYCE